MAVKYNSRLKAKGIRLCKRPQIPGILYLLSITRYYIIPVHLIAAVNLPLFL
jgi:hypothetical protein